MSRHSHAAFTLVELLVVITIIGMLMALLIPAANLFIEKGRQTQCLNNLKEIGQACVTYQTTKQHYPPESSDFNQIGFSAGQSSPVCWPALLVGNLGRGDLVSGLNDPNPATRGPWYVYMSVFVCPSNQPDQISDLSPALSYACNGGRKNAGGSATMQSDFKDNGVFMEFKKGQLPENVTMEFINRNDGLATTLLVMETLTAVPWSTQASAGTTENWNSILWPHSYKGTQPLAPGQNTPAPDDARVNDPYVLKNFTNSASGSLIMQSTISSKHPGGAMVVFADSHPMFMSENIDPIVIEYLMTPNGRGVKNPGSTTVVGQTIKMASGKTTISDVDLMAP